VFLEAAACGKPSIAGDAGGTGAAVIDGETGYRVDGIQVESIIEALGTLLTNPELAENIGKAGCERAVASFSWDGIAQTTKQIVERMES
jgi:phosphatidylinositol alpha-1,6-mannosyltransferase